MKIISGVFGVALAFSFPLPGYCEYPSMERALELFNANAVLATNVSMRSETYSQFAEDLHCQTTTENARNMETFLLNTVTSIVVTVSTNAVDDGTSAYILCNRGYWYSCAAQNFHDFPTNPANCMAVAAYLGNVIQVDFPTNLLTGSSLVKKVYFDPIEREAYLARRQAWRATRDLQFRVRDTNEAVEEYRKDLLTVCNVGVRGCRGIMDDTQYCAFTNQLATASNASEAERQILFDSIPSPQGEGD